MNIDTIQLVSFGHFEHVYLAKLTEYVQSELRTPVFLKEGRVDLIDFYDPARRQYNGNNLLDFVHALPSGKNDKVVGLFAVDLFIPILTYIFGQAQLNGKAAIASINRLMNEKYGLKPDRQLQMERFKKEVMHELGHTLGLIHCQHPECVMRSSTYVEDIDQKGASFCHQCKAQIGL